MLTLLAPMGHLALATLVFYILHSVLAWTGVKAWARLLLGLDRWYRLSYSMVSLLLATWVIYAYWGTRPAQELFAAGPAVLSLGWIFVFAGAALAAIAVFRSGASEFVGLAEERDAGLIRTGLYGRMRHPIYTGVILVALGWVLLDRTWSTLTVVGISLLYLPFGIALEERKLIRHFGEGYLRYRKEVPALLPRRGISAGADGGPERPAR